MTSTPLNYIPNLCALGHTLSCPFHREAGCDYCWWGFGSDNHMQFRPDNKEVAINTDFGRFQWDLSCMFTDRNAKCPRKEIYRLHYITDIFCRDYFAVCVFVWRPTKNILIHAMMFLASQSGEIMKLFRDILDAQKKFNFEY